MTNLYKPLSVAILIFLYCLQIGFGQKVDKGQYLSPYQYVDMEQAVINKHIKLLKNKYEGSNIKIEVFFSDLNNDHEVDAFLDYCVQSTDDDNDQEQEGNALMFDYCIESGFAIYLFNENVFTLSASILKSELRNNNDFDYNVNEAYKGSIYCSSMLYDDDDSRCCPSLTKKIFLRYDDGKIVEPPQTEQILLEGKVIREEPSTSKIDLEVRNKNRRDSINRIDSINIANEAFMEDSINASIKAIKIEENEKALSPLSILLLIFLFAITIGVIGYFTLKYNPTFTFGSLIRSVNFRITFIAFIIVSVILSIYWMPDVRSHEELPDEFLGAYTGYQESYFMKRENCNEIVGLYGNRLLIPECSYDFVFMHNNEAFLRHGTAEKKSNYLGTYKILEEDAYNIMIKCDLKATDDISSTPSYTLRISKLKYDVSFIGNCSKGPNFQLLHTSILPN